jgi:protein-arginine kinase
VPLGTLLSQKNSVTVPRSNINNHWKISCIFYNVNYSTQEQPLNRYIHVLERRFPYKFKSIYYKSKCVPPFGTTSHARKLLDMCAHMYMTYIMCTCTTHTRACNAVPHTSYDTSIEPNSFKSTRCRRSPCRGHA